MICSLSSSSFIEQTLLMTSLTYLIIVTRFITMMRFTTRVKASLTCV